MASPRPAVERPSTLEFMKLVTSPPVKIFVGAKVEPYVVPRDLLAYYSPYFTAAFRPNALKEGIEGVLRLPEDEPQHFELLLEHMMDKTPEEPFHCPVKELLEQCLSFFIFCDKYDVCAAAAVAEEALKNCDPHAGLEGMGDLVSFCLGRLHEDNPAMWAIEQRLAPYNLFRAFWKFAESADDEPMNAATSKRLENCLRFITFCSENDIQEGTDAAASFFKESLSAKYPYDNVSPVRMRELVALCFSTLSEDSKVIAGIRHAMAWNLLSSRPDTLVVELLKDKTISGPVMRTFRDITAPSASGHGHDLLNWMLSGKSYVSESRLKILQEIISAEEHD